MDRELEDLSKGPIPVASAWLSAVLQDGDLNEAWQWTGDDLRHDLATKWLYEHPNRVGDRDPERLCIELAERGPEHPSWPEFAADLAAFFQRIWAFVDFDTWGWADLKNPIGIDRELVAIVNVEGHFGDLEEGVQADSLPLVMEHTKGGWIVASLRKDDASDAELMRLDPRDD
jgi:hypothetical protein